VRNETMDYKGKGKNAHGKAVSGAAKAGGGKHMAGIAKSKAKGRGYARGQ